MTTPRWKHDCDDPTCCTFLKSYEDYYTGLLVDVYLSKKELLIFRKGDEGHDYSTRYLEHVLR